MIDFELRPEINTSETQRMVYEAARDFAAQFIKPNVMKWDEAQYFPIEIFEIILKLWKLKKFKIFWIHTQKLKQNLVI